ncbi:MAG: hypothetical protein LBT62_03135, partial [Deltaproteobacteria bacterium]|nr:hypothetical protein [Deltaproteobacteria bacterium]
ENNLKTWEELRIEFATNHFRILSQGGLQNGLILTPSSGRLTQAAVGNSSRWYSDFKRFHLSCYYNSLRVYANRIAHSDDLGDLGKSLQVLLDKSDSQPLSWFSKALLPYQDQIDQIIANKNAAIRQEIKSAFQKHADYAPNFIDGLVSINQDLKVKSAVKEASKERFKAEAFRIYTESVLEQASALAAGKTLPQQSRSGQVVAWLGGGRLPSAANLQALGADLALVKALKRFHSSTKNFLNGYFDLIVDDYLYFRRSNRLWYNPSQGGVRQVEGLEVDLMLLAFLEEGSDLLKCDFKIPKTVARNWSLANHEFLLRNQIFVDEVSDFSPVQLKCLQALSHPAYGAVSAAGDLESRITPWGVNSVDDLQWAIPKPKLAELSVNYRQSRQLVELTDTLSGSNGERYTSSYYDVHGVQTVVAEKCADLYNTAFWLTERIWEIKERCGQLPSVAVVVSSNSQIAPLTEALNKALTHHSLKAVPCRPGQPLGRTNDIRVIAIDQIRGLEFEALFLVNAADLLSRPNFRMLFYLAASRAVSYFGLTFKDTMPVEFDGIAGGLVASDWTQIEVPLETLNI